MRNIFGNGSFGARATFLGADPEESFRALEGLLGSLERERSEDAQHFQALTAAGKRRLDLVFQIKNAEEKLALQTRRWEASHQNAEALQAAQAAFDGLQAEAAQAQAEVDSYRAAVNAHAEAIGRYWNQIQEILDSLPEDRLDAARALIETCRVPSLKGVCPHGEDGIGCKKCQRGRKAKRYDPFAFARKEFLEEVPLAGSRVGQIYEMPPGALKNVTPGQIALGVGLVALAVGLVVFSRD